MASPRVIVVSVNTTRESDSAFRLALEEVQSGDQLLVVFARPLRTGSPHYEHATKGIRHEFDRKASEVLANYAKWASEAQVSFQTAELEGAHASEVVARKCQEVSASLLIQPASATKFQRLLRGEFGPEGKDFCEGCNPFLRGQGRIVEGAPCSLKVGKDVAVPDWKVVTVPLSE